MHFHHTLAVVADTEAEAREAIEAFLDDYQDQVWDWFTIGGRWSGVFDGSDAVCAADDTAKFLRYAETAHASVNQGVRELIWGLAGPDVDTGKSNAAHGTYDAPFGLGEGPVDAAASARLDDYYRRAASEFRALLASDEFTDERFAMTGYRLRQLGGLLMSMYGSGSYFYDAEGGTHGLEGLVARVGEEPARQWLVSVDLHN